MLPRRHRITDGTDYRRVVRRGTRQSGARTITSVLCTGAERPPRFGFIVSKQVGTAVTRNTVRRRLKAVCAIALPLMPAGADAVIRALPSSAQASFAELRDEVTRSLRRGVRTPENS